MNDEYSSKVLTRSLINTFHQWYIFAYRQIWLC